MKNLIFACYVFPGGMSCYSLTFWGLFRSLCPSLEDRPWRTQVQGQSSPVRRIFGAFLLLGTAVLRRTVAGDGQQSALPSSSTPTQRALVSPAEEPLRKLTGGTTHSGCALSPAGQLGVSVCSSLGRSGRPRLGSPALGGRRGA